MEKAQSSERMIQGGLSMKVVAGSRGYDAIGLLIGGGLVNFSS
jgi:hypothetical protein